MSLYVIDAGVAVKWFIEEQRSDKAKQLLVNYLRWIDDLIAPDLIIAEAANVFWKRAERGDITPHEAKENLNDLLSLNIPLVSSALLARKAFELAHSHKRSAYDCLYLALALEHNCELITDDTRLFNSVGSAFPLLKLVGDLSS
ncbi:MAG TPA: type II toxin-antitoxin system VapC family toxin [Blastocatellia bacterium]|nr:type II toxin-antitoxin system VapC family toxin [Blastocatellia bacterium]